MTSLSLIDQFALCEQWQDADQWDALGMLYFERGYVLNAGVCFQRADACRLRVLLVPVLDMIPLAVEMES